MNQIEDRAGNFVPKLDAVYEALIDEIKGWADTLGIETEFYNSLIEEGGRHAWADSLRSCDWAKRTAVSLLTAQGKTNQADDLNRRMEKLFESADAYEQKLDALEDQRKAHVDGIVARYRKAFGDEDPEVTRLWHLCKGIQRIWTFRLDNSLLETPEDFAEAIDHAFFDEDGAKRRALAEMKRLALEMVEHLQLLAGIEAEDAKTTEHTASSKAASDTERVDESFTPDTEPNNEQFGGPEVDPYDNRVVNWLGKRLYLGSEGTQVRELFWLLAQKPGVSHTLGEVQRVVDGMETDRYEQGEDAFQKSTNRIAKALSKLRKHLRENGLDDHVLIVKEGPSDSPSYTLIARFG